MSKEDEEKMKMAWIKEHCANTIPYIFLHQEFFNKGFLAGLKIGREERKISIVPEQFEEEYNKWWDTWYRNSRPMNCEIREACEYWFLEGRKGIKTMKEEI